MSLENHNDATTVLSLLAGTGAAVGLGKLFLSNEELTIRVVVGRAVTSAGLGAAAAALLSFFPNIPLAAQCGIAAALASLGTSGIERLFRETFGLNN